MVEICDEGSDGGFFLPLFKGEEKMDKRVRGTIYLFLLLYMFVGVNVVSDFFMNAIESITAKKRRVFSAKSSRYVTVLVWNDTVANLTLLALGSSAPEILLSCLEIMGAEFFSGALGPSTIVGSAAFNLLVIVAVCIYSIPSPEVRAIRYMAVFHVTAVFSLFAYFWLLVIVKLNSPDVVQVWESLLTLFMFPLLIGVSFAADRGYLEFLSMEKSQETVVPTIITPRALTPMGTEEDGSGGFHKFDLHPRLRHTHSNAHRTPTPQHRKSSPGTPSEQLGPDGRPQQVLPAGDNGHGICDSSDRLIYNPAGVISFREDAVTITGVAGEKELLVEVLRQNGCSGHVSCRYRTETLTAIPSYDYEEVPRGILSFADGENFRFLKLKILPKRHFEWADSFQLILEQPEGGVLFNPNDDGGPEHCVLTVTIANGLHVRPDGMMDHLSRLVEAAIDVDNLMLGLDCWREQIKDAFNVAGGEDEEELDEEEETPLQELMKGSGPQPSPMDYMMHVISFPWKLLFAFISPPANWASGWVLFFAALLYIGVVTALVADLASLFGCCFNFGDAATAITVVALGTSLPDLFASQTSARNDETADASIVNVTGSNSVNVFLGIGLPWTIASVYWNTRGSGDAAMRTWRSRYPQEALNYPNGIFVVKAGELGFSVTVFSCVAIIALAIIRARRVFFKGELGGPSRSKLVSAVVLVGLWIIYVGLSIWRINSDKAEVMVLPMIALAIGAVAACILFQFVIRSAGQRREAELPGRCSRTRASQVRPSQVPTFCVSPAPAKEDGGRASAAERGEGWMPQKVTEQPVTLGRPSETNGRTSELRLVQEAEAARREHEGEALRNLAPPRQSMAMPVVQTEAVPRPSAAMAPPPPNALESTDSGEATEAVLTPSTKAYSAHRRSTKREKGEDERERKEKKEKKEKKKEKKERKEDGEDRKKSAFAE